MYLYAYKYICIYVYISIYTYSVSYIYIYIYNYIFYKPCRRRGKLVLGPAWFPPYLGAPAATARRLPRRRPGARAQHGTGGDVVVITGGCVRDALDTKSDGRYLSLV